MDAEVVSTFDDRHLSGISLRSTAVNQLITGQYDYALLGSSWDQRCVVVTDAEFATRVLQLFLPANRGSSGLRGNHDLLLSEFSSQVAAELDVVEGRSEDLDSIFEQIQAKILEVRKLLDRPIRMLVDLSAVPRYFTLGAIALGLNESVADQVHALYSEAIYGEVFSSVAVPVPEHTASWEAVAVPRLEGDWYPTHIRHLLISVGFEPSKAARLADRWDADQFTVLFPAPGVRPEYEKRATEANSGWMRQFGIGPDRIISASPTDAISVWSASSKSGLIDSRTENVYALLCGSKPQSLGVALYSLARERPAVMYVRPTVHREADIRSNGVSWLYKMRDRTVIS